MDTLLHVVANTAVAANRQEILQTTWSDSYAEELTAKFVPHFHHSH